MDIIEKINGFFSSNTLKINMNKKDFFSSVSFLFIIYFLAIISIIRVNFSYNDDLRRAIEGNDVAGVFSRHISKFVSYFLHTSEHVTDISPLPQLVACVFLALAGFILVRVICKKTNKFLLIASLPLGLSPYFLECFSYKFDAPYMALSILAGIFPFLFMHKKTWLYSLVCIASTLVMTMTYQAASGIFIMMVVYIFFTNMNHKKITIKNNFIFLGVSLLSYCVAIIMFRWLFMQPITIPNYVSTNMPSFGNIIPVFLQNAGKYFQYVNKDFNMHWKALLLAVIIIFYIKTILFSKINKILSFFLSSIFLVLLFISTFGSYLILEAPFFGPRGMYAIGVFIAILCVDIGFSLKKIFSIPSIALIWCFFVFSFSYGNALSDQKRYNDFRTELLLKDLSSLFPEKTNDSYKIKIIGTIGWTPVVKNVAVNNPMIYRLVPVNLRENWAFGYFYLATYFRFPLYKDDRLIDEAMPVVFDSYYHTIKNESNQIVVILK